MNSKNTKAELLAEVKRLENAIKARDIKIEKLKANQSKSIELIELFKVVEMNSIYLDELRNKTSLVYTNTIHSSKISTFGETREFHDKNRVLLIWTQDPFKYDTARLLEATFFRRLK